MTAVQASYPYWLSTYVDTTAVSNQGVPVGAIITWPLTAPPTNYLVCNGNNVLITQYSELYGVLGNTYGSGNQAALTVTAFTTSLVNGSNLVYFLATNPTVIVGNVFTVSGITGTYSYLNSTYTATAADGSGITAVNNTGNNTILSASISGSLQVVVAQQTFTLPNATGKTLRGGGTGWTVGATGGSDTSALAASNVPSHRHDITIIANGSGASSGGISTSSTPGSGTNLTTGIIYNNAGSNVTAAGANGASFSVQNAFLTLNYCIKYQ